MEDRLTSRDLVKGNWFMLEPYERFAECLGVNPNNDCPLFADADLINVYNYDISNIKPIPLSEEILSKIFYKVRKGL